MEQRSNYAAGKGVQTMPKREEFVLGMEQRSNYAAGKGVQTMPKKEEFVSGIGETIFRK